MCAEGAPREFYLNPGAFLFAHGHARIRTLLGSCVAITFWHPLRHLGAMCHYLLADRRGTLSHGVDPRYAEDVIPLIRNHYAKLGLAPGEFVVQMFGGSSMFPGLSLGATLAIGARNAHEGRILLEAHGFTIEGEDLAGTDQRMVAFDVWTGRIRVRQGAHRVRTYHYRGLPALDDGALE